MSDQQDYGLLKQPLGNYGTVVADSPGYGPGQNPPSPYRRPATTVAQRDAPVARKQPRKAPAKEPRTKKREWKPIKDAAKTATSNIYVLFYFSDISKSYTFDDFLARLHGSADPTRWPETSQFLMHSVDIVRKSNSETVWTDLGNALHESGAVVVYWGHSERLKGSRKARNLRPRRDSDDAASDITIEQLRSLVQTINAKSFILAACATDGCLGKVKRDAAIVATDSGKDLLTNTLDWANALEAFLMKFIAGGSITDSIAEANKSFAKSSDPDDRFVMASGSGALTLTS